MTPVATTEKIGDARHEERYGPYMRRATDRISQGPEPKRGLRSTFVVSLAMFFALNWMLSLSSTFENLDRFRFPYRGWAWWIFDDLRKHSEETHNVALLGSSLMVSAVSGADANYLNKPLDLTTYHKAAYLDQTLRTTFGGMFNTYNLSQPGQMPSDAYLSLRGMVNIADRPDVVIYGLAPRDFLDSTMSDPVDTEPFKYLSRLSNHDEVAPLLFRNPLTKLDFWLHKNVVLYGNSLDIQMLANGWMSGFLARAVPQPWTNKPFTWWDRVKLMPSYLPGEIRPSAVISAPMDEKTAASQFRDNTKEYLDRYKHPDPHVYKTQFAFLKKLAEFCRREKIDLILVNMPITTQNVSLLKPQTYFNYIQALREFSYNNSVPAYDLSEFSNYRREDFHDPVHLNGFGAAKFFNRLACILKGAADSQSKLIMAGRNLETRLQLAAHSRGTSLAGKGTGM
jgi:hypothetical protein